MKTPASLLILSLSFVAAAVLPARAKPEVWMMPPTPLNRNGQALRDLFEHPEQWAQTRKKVDVLGGADWIIDRSFTDEELRRWFLLIDQWGLKLGLESWVMKKEIPSAQPTFERDSRFWDRFQSLGGKIYSVALDEPLTCARERLHRPDSYAVDQAAQFIALFRARYPGIQIGDIEGYPFISLEDQIAWIDALQGRLKAMNVRGMDFYRLDVDWTHFVLDVPGARGNRGSWIEVKELQDACHARHLPFSLIYWAAPYPALARMGLADDSTWYNGVIEEGYDYALASSHHPVVAGVRHFGPMAVPDQCVIESWVKAPATTLPETADWTFTRSVLDFCNRFVK